MKIVTIASSQRRHGNSETLLDEFLSSAGKGNIDIEKIALSALKITPCDGCGSCFKTGECVIKDDMQFVYKELLDCDRLIIASPIQFQALPCQLKCVIDRCQALWARKHVLKKRLVSKTKKTKRRGSAILTCASKGAKHTFTGSVITLKAWFNTLDISYKKEFAAEGLEDKEAAAGSSALSRKIVAFAKKLI